MNGNERAALVAAFPFLAINGWELEAPEPETVAVILGLADGSVPEEDVGAWIRAHLIPWAD